MYMPVINTFNVRRMSERRFSLFMVLWGLMALAAMAQTRYYVTPDGQAPKVGKCLGRTVLRVGRRFVEGCPR